VGRNAPLMKTIANLFSVQEVDHLRILLGSAGIEIFVPDEVTSTLLPHTFMTKAGIRVQVSEEDEALAREVIAEYRQQNADEEE